MRTSRLTQKVGRKGQNLSMEHSRAQPLSCRRQKRATVVWCSSLWMKGIL